MPHTEGDIRGSKRMRVYRRVHTRTLEAPFVRGHPIKKSQLLLPPGRWQLGCHVPAIIGLKAAGTTGFSPHGCHGLLLRKPGGRVLLGQSRVARHPATLVLTHAWHAFVSGSHVTSGLKQF